VTFGSKDKVAKITNTTLPLVVLTWLRQLEEYFYEISDNNKHEDWNAHGKYCPVKARNKSTEFPLDNIHMIKANSTAVTKLLLFNGSNPTSKIIKNCKIP
jgi:hypothetical protein